MIIIAPGFLIFLTLSKRPLDSWGGFATSSLLQTKLECFLLKPLLDFSIKWQVISMYCQILVGRLALLHYKILCYALLRTLCTTKRVEYKVNDGFNALTYPKPSCYHLLFSWDRGFIIVCTMYCSCLFFQCTKNDTLLFSVFTARWVNPVIFQIDRNLEA